MDLNVTTPDGSMFKPRRIAKKVIATATANSLGVRIRVATAPNVRPVMWCDVDIDVDQIRRLADDAEKAKEELPDLTATSTIIPLDAEEGQSTQAHFDRLAIEGVDMNEAAKKLDQDLTTKLTMKNL